MMEIRRVRAADLKTIPEPTPNPDQKFAALLEGALKGEVPVYFATVPLALCLPFDLDYRPDAHPVGAQAIQALTDEWKQGRFQNLIVYPRGKWFILSDDYIPLFAALQGRPDYLPCWVLGKPDNDLARDVQGPLPPQEVRKAFGLE